MFSDEALYLIGRVKAVLLAVQCSMAVCAYWDQIADWVDNIIGADFTERDL